MRLLASCLLVFTLVGSACSAELKSVAEPPSGLNAAIAKSLQPTGQQLVGDDGPICTVWLAKELPIKPDFKPSLNVKYPLLPGQLIGILRVDQASGYRDFRGQDVAAGVYTLRYGLQPVDGNHIGTSETYDFLLAIPAAVDTDPATIKSFEGVVGKSAKTTGSNHPAILSLLAPTADQKSPQLVHDESREFWIVSFSTTTAEAKPLPVRLIVVGVSEG